MASELRSSLCQFLALALLVTLPISCSSVSVGPGGQISKVKYYHLHPGSPVNTVDPAVQFERDYLLYGAITREEVSDRFGHYYTIFWKATDRTQPVTVRFEYRQANTGLDAKVVTEEVVDVKRVNSSKFQVSGSEYNTSGRVTAWKVTLLRGQEELASQQSYLWN
ncbi:hypothetical protein EI77_02457 [Prosthecobacter fusiformis]|uniref:Uncharacterized protein n=1 Tax=Prosthecobacter fusiformis TaxID=48464 RepID=A0A4V3FFM1_9BACT|nr:hypothetical protein [Prosthecobacter fusiformis]TDU71333.1 hypothetical protein EI77_02457 [Prosthecobacter fusiformis]